MDKLSIEQLKTLIIASVIFILGVFFCCSLSIGINGLSVILGVLLIIIGVIFIANAVIVKKELLNSAGLIGVTIITFGIILIANKLAGIIFIFIPWFLMMLGLSIVADGLLDKFSRKENNTNFIIKLVIGIVAIILGLLLQLIDGFIEYASLMLGILLIIYALYLIFVMFTKTSTKQ